MGQLFDKWPRNTYTKASVFELGEQVLSFLISTDARLCADGGC